MILKIHNIIKKSFRNPIAYLISNQDGTNWSLRLEWTLEKKYSKKLGQHLRGV